jgi:hypothetical protein
VTEVDAVPPVVADVLPRETPEVDDFSADDLDVGHDDDQAGEGVADDVDEEPPSRSPPPVVRTRSKGYKPGTRLVETKKAVRDDEPPWWASNDPMVWDENQQRLRTTRGTSVPSSERIIGRDCW